MLAAATGGSGVKQRAVADLVAGYNIVEKLGVGARSQIYQVVRPETGEVFALKRVIRAEHEDTRFLEQAVTEYEVSSKLDHPYLRKCHEIKRIRSWMKLTEVQVVMEYVKGTSLDKRRPERIDEAVDIFLKLAEGLDALHQTGHIHADIKPNNVLLTHDHSVKIIDFGQSCPIGHRKPRIQGTPDYIAPEQVERRTLTPQTDVFCLGATLYWVLTDRTYPTLISKKGRPDQGLMRAVPSPQTLNPEVPSVLSRLVMESCSHRRSDRPRDMKQVINKLEMSHHVLAKRKKAGHDMSTLSHVSEAPVETAAPPVPPPIEDDYDYGALGELTGEPSGTDAPSGDSES